MKKNLIIFALLILAHCRLTNTADQSPREYIDYSWYPKYNPFTIFVTMKKQNDDYPMFAETHYGESNLLVLQGHSCRRELLHSLFTTLKEQLNRDKELHNSNTFQWNIMLPHQPGSAYALTWINAQGKGFIKNYIHPTGYESTSCKPSGDLVFHLLSLSRPMDIDYDIAEKIAAFKRNNPKKGSYYIAQFAEQNLRNITKPTSFIIIDYKKFKESFPDPINEPACCVM